jgi:hypothetical protein
MKCGPVHHLPKDCPRLNVSGDCDGLILTTDCGLAHRKTYDDGLDKQSYYQGGKATKTGARISQ